jgi:hypothetical protein
VCEGTLGGFLAEVIYWVCIVTFGYLFLPHPRILPYPIQPTTLLLCASHTLHAITTYIYTHPMDSWTDRPTECITVVVH